MRIRSPWPGVAGCVQFAKPAWLAPSAPVAACALAGQLWPTRELPHLTAPHRTASSPPCPQYHIVILPTFRDEHAELVQYLLQLQRLQRQRFFLTQHNPGAERGWAG